MGKVDAVIKDGRLSEYQILRAYFVILFSVFAAIKPSQVADARPIGKVGHDTLLMCTHWESLETQNLAHHLYKRHVASQFVNGIYLRTVYVFIRIVFQ